jgi:hypothetical protein
VMVVIVMVKFAGVMVVVMIMSAVSVVMTVMLLVLGVGVVRESRHKVVAALLGNRSAKEDMEQTHRGEHQQRTQEETALVGAAGAVVRTNHGNPRDNSSTALVLLLAVVLVIVMVVVHRQGHVRCRILIRYLHGETRITCLRSI